MSGIFICLCVVGVVYLPTPPLSVCDGGGVSPPPPSLCVAGVTYLSFSWCVCVCMCVHVCVCICMCFCVYVCCTKYSLYVLARPELHLPCTLLPSLALSSPPLHSCPLPALTSPHLHSHLLQSDPLPCTLIPSPTLTSPPLELSFPPLALSFPPLHSHSLPCLLIVRDDVFIVSLPFICAHV